MWDARRREPLALAKLRNSGLRHLGRQGLRKVVTGRDARSQATGKSMPGAMMPSTRSAAANRLTAFSSSTETMARRSAKWKPGAAGSRSTATTYTPRSRARLQQPELAGTRP